MDTIADFLIRIRNSSLANRLSLTAPYSKACEGLAVLLKKEGWLKDFDLIEEDGHRRIKMTLTKEGGKVRRWEVKRISKPGRRVYLRAKGIRNLRGLGMTILSTPKGLMVAKEALKNNLGGEVICKII